MRPTYQSRPRRRTWPCYPTTPRLRVSLNYWATRRLTPGSYGRDELLFWLFAKIPRDLWDECRAAAERKARALTYEDLSVLLLE